MGQYLRFIEKIEGERDHWPLTIFFSVPRLTAFLTYIRARGRKANTISKRCDLFNQVNQN